MSDSDKIKDIVTQFQNIRDNQPIDENIGENIASMLKNLTENESGNIDYDNNPLTGGLIGNLAKELSEEISLEDMNLNLEDTDDIGSVLTNLISGENPMQFMNLVQNVGNKIQDKITKNNINLINF